MISPYLYPGLINQPFSTMEVVKYVSLVACEVWEITHDEFKDKKKKPIPIQARQFTCWFLSKYYELSNEEIGAIFQRDRTSIYHSCIKVNNAMDGYDPTFKEKIQQALTILNR